MSVLEQVFANRTSLYLSFSLQGECHRLQGAISEKERYGWLERDLQIKHKKTPQLPSSI